MSTDTTDFNRKRAVRTRAEHHEILVTSLQGNKELLTNTFPSAEARRSCNEKWKQLQIKLNSSGYGEKTIQQWQRVLTDWLSKTKTKWPQIKKKQTGTGGGPGNCARLTELEERLLTLKGWSAVIGDGKTVEMGIVVDIPPNRETLLQNVHQGNTGTRQDVVEEIDIFTREADKIITSTPKGIKRPLSGNKKEKQETRMLERQHGEVMQVLHGIDEKMARMATATEAAAGAITSIAETLHIIARCFGNSGTSSLQTRNT